MPALDTSASSVAMGQINNLDFGNIIGGPLNAVIDAQAMAAQTTVDFVQRVGFQDNNGQLEAVNLTFMFEDGSGIFRRVQVPLLTVIPVPFIVVDAVDIQFKARIAASAQQSSEERRQSEFKAAAEAKLRWGRQKFNMSASYSSKKDSKATQESKYSVEYTMDVHVHASQSGLTQGMGELLNILQDGISNTPMETQITIFSLPSSLSTSDGSAFTGDGSFKILVLDAAGEPIDQAAITVTTSAGAIVDVTASTGTDGIGTLSLAGDDSVIVAGTNLTETLQISVNTGGADPEVTNLARAVTIIRPA